MRSFILALLLTHLAAAAPFRASDGAFEFQAPEGTRSLDRSPSSTLALLTPAKVVVLALTSKPMKMEPAKFLASVKKQSAWTVVDTHMGSLGGRPAAVYYAQSEFKVPGYQTVTAVVLGRTRTYTFKIHYPKGKASDYEAWFQKLKWLKQDG